jgi:hypothetical protein
MTDNYKNLDNLINMLEEMEAADFGYISFPKAIHLLANEIKNIKTRLEAKTGSEPM